MKLQIKSLLILVIIGAGFLACEYDGPTAVYNQDRPEATSPTITSVDPANSAGPGVMSMTINGQNFSENMDDNAVYVNGYMAEIFSSSANQITFRRPAVSGDSMYIKVATKGALNVAGFGPYQITPVHSLFGAFIENLALNAIAFDKDDNCYVCQNSPRNVYKITPSGEKTLLGESSRAVTDAKVSSATNKLILLVKNKSINQLDLSTGEETEFAKVGKSVAYGDFDSNGNFITGGRKCPIYSIHPDGTMIESDVMADYEILCLRVFDNHVYVLVTLTGRDEPVTGIWKIPILDANGTLGERELFVEWVTHSGEFAESTPLHFNFDKAGNMYVGTDYANPVFVLNADGSKDILYKDILPSEAKQLVWNNSNDLYMILDGTENNIVKIEMGREGAPYFGR